MARPIDDDGHCLVAIKPLRMGKRAYEPGKLPDPVQCAGCWITVNDRNDKGRLRAALSDGSAWRFVSFEDDLHQPSVDLAAMAREQVALAVRGLPVQPAAAVRLIEAFNDGTNYDNMTGASLASAPGTMITVTATKTGSDANDSFVLAAFR